jgi:hypothetical protein
VNFWNQLLSSSFDIASSLLDRKAAKMPPKADFTPWKELDPMLIPHLSSATGDTIHVAAALVLYERLDVIVVHHGAVGSCEGLLNFYRNIIKQNEFGIIKPNKPDIIKPNKPDVFKPTKRVKVVYTEDEKTAYTISTALTNAKRDIEASLARLLDGGVLPFLDPNAVPSVPPVRITSVQAFSVCTKETLVLNCTDPGSGAVPQS